MIRIVISFSMHTNIEDPKLKSFLFLKETGVGSRLQRYLVLKSWWSTNYVSYKVMYSILRVDSTIATCSIVSEASRGTRDKILLNFADAFPLCPVP